MELLVLEMIRLAYLFVCLSMQSSAFVLDIVILYIYIVNIPFLYL